MFALYAREQDRLSAKLSCQVFFVRTTQRLSTLRQLLGAGAEAGFLRHSQLCGLQFVERLQVGRDLIAENFLLEDLLLEHLFSHLGSGHRAALAAPQHKANVSRWVQQEVVDHHEDDAENETEGASEHCREFVPDSRGAVCIEDAQQDRILHKGDHVEDDKAIPSG